VEIVTGAVQPLSVFAEAESVDATLVGIVIRWFVLEKFPAVAVEFVEHWRMKEGAPAPSVECGIHSRGGGN
jgi:hypothetical protein